MILGLLPDPRRAIAEMTRVLRPGGLLLAGAHGREYFWEADDAMLRSVGKRYVLGYRMEFWPRGEEEWLLLFGGVGLDELSTRRVYCKNEFLSGGDAYDFCAAIASCSWYERFPLLPGKPMPSVSARTSSAGASRRSPTTSWWCRGARAETRSVV